MAETTFCVSDQLSSGRNQTTRSTYHSFYPSKTKYRKAPLITYGRGARPLPLTGRQFACSSVRDPPSDKNDDKESRSNGRSARLERWVQDAEYPGFTPELSNKRCRSNEILSAGKQAPVCSGKITERRRERLVESATASAVKPRTRRLPVGELVCLAAGSHDTASPEPSYVAGNYIHDPIGDFTNQAISRERAPCPGSPRVYEYTGHNELNVVRKQKQTPVFKLKSQAPLLRNQKLASRTGGGTTRARIGDGFEEPELVIVQRRLKRPPRQRKRKSYLLHTFTALAVSVGPLPEVVFDCPDEPYCMDEPIPAMPLPASQAKNDNSSVLAMSGAPELSQRRSSFTKHKSLIMAQLAAFKAPVQQHFDTEDSDDPGDVGSLDEEHADSDYLSEDDEEVGEAAGHATSTEYSPSDPDEPPEADYHPKDSFRSQRNPDNQETQDVLDEQAMNLDSPKSHVVKNAPATNGWLSTVEDFVDEDMESDILDNDAQQINTDKQELVGPGALDMYTPSLIVAIGPLLKYTAAAGPPLTGLHSIRKHTTSPFFVNESQPETMAADTRRDEIVA